jgi:hypothetical protein
MMKFCNLTIVYIFQIDFLPIEFKLFKYSGGLGNRPLEYITENLVLHIWIKFPVFKPQKMNIYIFFNLPTFL